MTLHPAEKRSDQTRAPMKTWIALLRALNVGGRHVLPMRDLIAILAGRSAEKIQTCIQSGNAVFQASISDRGSWAKEIGLEIERKFGFETRVILLSLQELDEAIQANPFPDAAEETGKLHLAFLDSIPPRPDLEALQGFQKESEQFQLLENWFYLHAPEGVGRSRLMMNVEKTLGVPMTFRNWRSLGKIQEMAQALTE